MPRPPIYKEMPADQTPIASTTEVLWQSKPLKELYMKGGTKRYFLIETVYRGATDQFSSLSIPIPLRTGWRGDTQYSLVCYAAEEGIGGRSITMSAQDLFLNGEPQLVETWETWPSDKNLAEAVYRAEGLGHY